MELEEYRGRLDQFEEQLNKSLHRYLSGESTDLGTARWFAEFSDLFELETLREFDRALAECPGHLSSRRRSLRRCRAYTVEHCLDRIGQPLREQAADEENSRTVRFGGHDVPVAELRARIAAEPDPHLRRRMSELCSEASAEAAGLLRRAAEAMREEAQKLGFNGCRDVIEQTSGFDYQALSSAFEALLRASDPVYLDALTASIQTTTGVAPGALCRCDAGFWVRANDPRFGLVASQREAAVGEITRGLSVKPEPGRSIAVATPDLPAWRVQPCCVPVRVPEDVRVLVPASGGQDGYGALLHETGHACQLAWASPALPAEFRRTGDRALAETFGFLFESLLTEPSWLSGIAGVSRPSAFVRFMHLLRAYRIRCHAARLRFELEYDGGGLRDPEGRWVEIFREATGVSPEPGSWTVGGSAAFESGDYLRAWALEVRLREFLRTRFGHRWYVDRSAGRFLKEIWETGFFYTAEELGAEIGLGAFDAQPLFDELGKGLRQ